MLAVGVGHHVDVGRQRRRAARSSRGTRQSWLPGSTTTGHVEAGRARRPASWPTSVGHPVVVEDVADEQHDVDAVRRAPRRRAARRRRPRRRGCRRRGGRRRAAGARVAGRRRRQRWRRTAASWSAAGPVLYGPSRQASAARRPVVVGAPAELGHRRGEVGDGVELGALERGEPRRPSSRAMRLVTCLCTVRMSSGFIATRWQNAERALVELVGRQHPADQAELAGLLGVEQVAGEQQLLGGRRADLASASCRASPGCPCRAPPGGRTACPRRRTRCRTRRSGRARRTGSSRGSGR